MLNLLTKTKFWMFTSLIAATSIFGKTTAQCPKPCTQPSPPTQVCSGDPCCPSWPTPVLNAAYNYPARIQTRCPWDFFFDASFIYWQPIEENLEIGFANDTADVAGVLTRGTSGHFINMDFNFKPGFKLGLGANFDHDAWDARLEYTWFHSTNSQSSNRSADGQILAKVGNPSQIVTNTLYHKSSQTWRLKMDVIDLDLGRWYYVGTNLTFHPVFGARADWIRQDLLTETSRTAVAGGAAADVGTVHQKSLSWAIGPKVGLDTNWNLGAGFRFFGNAEADLLFTEYTRLSFRETHTANPTAPFNGKQNRVYAVKPHFDLEMGFAWGTYLDCNNWYMDFVLGYGFQVFFDQNMFRQYNDNVMFVNSVLPNGNLYLQGLTASFRLDF